MARSQLNNNDIAAELAEYRENKRLRGNTSARGKIQVRIFSLQNGLQIYEEVIMIHIKGKKNNLLIMEDYFPIIGKVDGNIIITRSEGEMVMTDIRGFYCHEHNSFFLLLKENSNVG